ncbi:hypothetical protein NBO_58g0008 [Nosema bombycis CQ1]|uniref:Uncharacterized protein n=1 Tax=Nosema bombycis (strain CQ1 / CVCC 102059) TaxID=578461 RepID=R0KUA3_NOSB1|nr:hypothetical protein NBO_58g0008 [Nosema bombycis CQ1]|eukprot:EOB13802.1 hypothetical protein NBO_58g0008 [Nosema bombycis CQ1]
MESPLKQRRNKILKRLNITLNTTFNTIIDINKSLESIIKMNKSLEETSEIFKIWREKMV